MTSRHVIASAVGNLLLVFEDGFLIRIDLSKESLSTEPLPQAALTAGRQLDEYLRGTRREFTIPARIKAKGFALSVFEQLQSIPYGTTSTYGDLARLSGRPQAARAVGTILKNNLLPFLVPCHRIVKANGGIGGYAYGEDFKQRLLAMERSGLN